MKRPMNTPAVLAFLLILVISSLIALSGYRWYEAQERAATFVYALPQKVKVSTEINALYPHQDEIKNVLINEKLAIFSNTRPIQPKETDDLSIDQYIRRETIRESTHQDNGLPAYLVIAGTYSDELFMISKQAQMQRMGLPAEIVQLGDSRYKNLCVGRYSERNKALALANILEEKHDISAYVFDKKSRP